jgi:uncharacterized protein (DUF4415 family)
MASVKKLNDMSDSKDMSDFERELLESIRQAVTGKFNGACVTHTPEAIKKRGRPAGTTKRPATLRIDELALEAWRASGKGWQTRAAAILAKHAPSH